MIFFQARRCRFSRWPFEVQIARKHLGWYTKGMHGSAEFRNFVNFIDDPRKVLEEIEAFYEPFLRRRAA